MNRNIVMVGAGIVAVGAFLAVWLLGGEAEMAEGSTPRTIQGTEGEAAPPAPLPVLGSSGRPDDPEPAPAEGPRPKGAAELAQALVAKHNRPDGSLPMDPVGGDAGVPEGWAEGDALPPIPMIRFVADREGIQAAVQERKRQIQECYDGWAKSPDAPEGKIVARFTIAPGGPGMPAQIKDAGLTASGLNHLAMEGCVLNALEGLGFESPEGEVTVNYPFTFKRTGPAAAAPGGDPAAAMPEPGAEPPPPPGDLPAAFEPPPTDVPPAGAPTDPPPAEDPPLPDVPPSTLPAGDPPPVDDP